MAISSLASSGGLQPYEQLFTSSGTWTKPSGVKNVEVEIVGGANGYNSSGYYGGGGGYWKGLVDVTGVGAVTVTVGSGGVTNGYGGNSSFGYFIQTTQPTVWGNYSSGCSYYPSVPDYSGSAVAVGGYAAYGANTDIYDYLYLGLAAGNIASISGRAYGYTYYSTDFGTSWTFSTAGAGLLCKGSPAAKLQYDTNGSYVVNGYCSGQGANTMYYSANNGASWSAVTLSSNATDVAGDFCYGPAGWIRMGASNGLVWKAATPNLTWTSSTVTGYTWDGYYPRIVSNGTHYVMFKQNSSTIWYSTDGVAWTSQSITIGFNNNSQPSTNQYLKVIGTTIYFVANNNYIYKLTWNGSTYTLAVANSNMTATQMIPGDYPLAISSSGNQYVFDFSVNSASSATLSNGYTTPLLATRGAYGSTVPIVISGYPSSYQSYIYQSQFYKSAFPQRQGNTSAGASSVTGNFYTSAWQTGAPPSLLGWGQGSSAYTNTNFFPGCATGSNAGTGNGGAVMVRWWA